MSTGTLLETADLCTHFFTEAGLVKAVDGVSFSLNEGETIALVGESGSGKTVTVLSILRIVPRPGRIVRGSILFDGQDILSISQKEMRKIRGSKMAMISQDPTSSLNPVFTVGTQLTDMIRAHQALDKKRAEENILRLLDMVGMPDPSTRIREYPHQFSGGMKQRIAIARALCCQPALLFADEPTTNLDVTTQAQILELLKSLRTKLNMSMVLITHDMGIVAEMSERVVVLYAGKVCEIAETRELYSKPKHPYTKALLNSTPRLDMKKTLEIIPGNIPNLMDPPSGCRFHPRCKYVIAECQSEEPKVEEITKGHFTACHLASTL